MSYKIAFSGNDILFAKYEISWMVKEQDNDAYMQYLADREDYLNAMAEIERINSVYGDLNVITDEDGNEIPKPIIEVSSDPVVALEVGPEYFLKDVPRSTLVYSEEEKDETERILKDDLKISEYNVDILPCPSDFALYMLNKKKVTRTTREEVINLIDIYENTSKEFLINEKMNVLKEFCQNEIFKGFKANVLGEDFERTYELKILDQVNYNSQINKFNIDPSLAGVVWSSNEGPTYYTKEQFMQLIPYIDGCLNYNWNIFYVVKYRLESMEDRIAIDMIDINTAWAEAKAYIDLQNVPEDQNNRTDEEVINPSEDMIPPVVSANNAFTINDEDVEDVSLLKEKIETCEDGEIYVRLYSDATIETPIVITKPTVLDLNGHLITSLKSGIIARANLTLIDGVGVGGVYAATNGDYKCIDVADGTTIIEGGNYFVGTDAEGLGNSCIYVSGDEAHLIINGGYFSTEASYNDIFYVLNKKNSASNASIVVNAGSFLKYNPEDGDESIEDDSFVPASSTVDEIGGVYVVCVNPDYTPDTTEDTNTEVVMEDQSETPVEEDTTPEEEPSTDETEPVETEPSEDEPTEEEPVDVVEEESSEEEPTDNNETEEVPEEQPTEPSEDTTEEPTDIETDEETPVEPETTTEPTEEEPSEDADVEENNDGQSEEVPVDVVEEVPSEDEEPEEQPTEPTSDEETPEVIANAPKRRKRKTVKKEK